MGYSTNINPDPDDTPGNNLMGFLGAILIINIFALVVFLNFIFWRWAIGLL